ncbi:MAG: 3D domain-containing protein [Candidatus Pacebacteria bacterium]|nr:3D domain-containing protein [Candidatus Paceibacterota bacterium]
MFYKLRFIITVLVFSIIITFAINVTSNNIQSAFAPLLIPDNNIPVVKTKNFMLVEATAYTLAEGNGDGYTATMTIPVQGRTVAVDPSIIPYGTELTINGIPGYIAEDCGGAIKGRKIDIFMNSYDEAINFGRQNLILFY